MQYTNERIARKGNAFIISRDVAGGHTAAEEGGVRHRNPCTHDGYANVENTDLKEMLPQPKP